MRGGRAQLREETEAFVQMSPFRRSDSKDTVCLFDTKLGGKGTYIPEAAPFCHEGGYYAGPSNKPFLRAEKVVLLEASLGKLLTGFWADRESTLGRDGWVNQRSQT